MKISVTLNQEEWDRLIEVLEKESFYDPDSNYLLEKINNQLIEQ